ncbi:MAG: hypothetical protein MUE42_06545 [Opitutaceae bacterium]|nr:hypothetical protein [Opitutaceae bacterium]
MFRFTQLIPRSWPCIVAWALACPFALHGAEAEVTVVHPTLDQRVGYPAIIAPGGALPAWTVRSPAAGTLESALVCTETGAVIQRLAPSPLTAGEPHTVTLDGALPPEGVYHLELRILDDGAATFRTTSSFAVLDAGALPAQHSKIAHPGPKRRMRYIPDVLGNRLPDFSGAGYRGGSDLPRVPTVLRLQPAPGDATRRVQAAIDEVSAREPDTNGFRGAIELAAGLYEIEGTLRIGQSGVVLRGVGAGPAHTPLLDPAQNLTLDQWRATQRDTTATLLVATGPKHRPLLSLGGKTGIKVEEGSRAEILDDYVPVGRRWFHVSEPAHFKVGDTLQLERRGNAEWISAIKMNQIPERPGTVQWSPFSLFFQYTITAIDGDRITLDSGLVCAVERRWGGGCVRRFTEGGRIRDIGVEHLRAISFWRIDATGGDDTRHADQFVVLNRVRDAWVDRVVAEHFTPNVGGTFQTGRDSLGVTLQNSSALAADRSFYSGIGYEATGRTHKESGVYVGRYGFHFSGQNGLVRNCYALHMRHAFVVNSRVAGPNVFTDSVAEGSLTNSEAHHRWSVGGLYDNVRESRSIALMNRLGMGSGHGWAAVNYVAWNTRGALIAEQPPTAQNWAIGHVGERTRGPHHDWNMEQYGWSDGYWESHGHPVEPASLHARQVADRRGETGVE